MSVKPYDYENRSGLLPISWNDFHALCKGLVAAVARFQPEIILPIGRAGYYPGTLIAHMLQVELFPIRLSRRIKDIITYQSPRWFLEPPASVAGRRVLIVDEICSTGETLTLVKQKALALGAVEARSAILYSHTRGAAIPDYIGLISDALILNPWDREIWKEGRFQFHPEYVRALQEQGLPADPSLLIGVEAAKIAKG
jgi:hypoxanthine phosphoribosyltransferase